MINPILEVTSSTEKHINRTSTMGACCRTCIESMSFPLLLLSHLKTASSQQRLGFHELPFSVRIGKSPAKNALMDVEWNIYIYYIPISRIG